MKFLQSGYKGKAKDIRVYLLNDLHFGADAVDYNLLKRVFKDIDKNRDHARILINGDIIEGVTKYSTGDLFHQRMTPKEQLDLAVEMFTPYKELIDGITIGNHDYRTERDTSFDPIETFARYLGIEDKYLGDEGIVGFSWNKCFYSVQLHHGVGGGATLAAVERNMKRLWKSDSHVMYCGHWHKEFAKPIKRVAIDPYNKQAREERRWMVCGNTILNTEKYAKRAGFEESYPSQAVLTMSGRQHSKGIEVEWIR